MDEIMHLRLERYDLTLPRPLREVHGQISVTQQLVRGHLTGALGRDADTRVDAEFLTVQVDGPPDLAEQPLSSVPCIIGDAVLQQDGELVTAEPRRGIARA